MNILSITNFFVGFMVSEIRRVSVFGYFPLLTHTHVHSESQDRVDRGSRGI